MGRLSEDDRALAEHERALTEALAILGEVLNDWEMASRSDVGCHTDPDLRARAYAAVTKSNTQSGLQHMAERHAAELSAALGAFGLDPGVEVVQIIADPAWELLGPESIKVVSTIGPAILAALFEHLAEHYGRNTPRSYRRRKT